MADFIRLGDIKGEFANQAIIDPNFRPEKAVAQPEGFVIPTDGDDIVIDGLDRMANAYVDEDVDGYMRLGDIKGEIIRSDGDEIIYGGGGHNYLNAFTIREDGAGRFTTGGGGDSLTDAGLGNNSFKQPAHIWTTGGASTFKADALADGGSYSGGGTWTCGSSGDFTDADALVQQVNGTIGYEMQVGMGITTSGNGIRVTDPGYNSLGSAVNALGASNPMGIEPNQMLGSISRCDMFAPTNIVIRENAN